MPDCGLEDQAVIGEIHAFIWSYNLRPARIICYQRQAWVGTQYDLGLRVTFDTNLTWQCNPLALIIKFKTWFKQPIRMENRLTRSSIRQRWNEPAGF